MRCLSLASFGHSVADVWPLPVSRPHNYSLESSPMTDHTTAASPAERYGLMAIALHWIMAPLLLGLFVLGAYMSDLPFSPDKLRLINWHKWLGAIALMLAVLRLLWRVTHRPPALPAQIVATMPSWQQAAHHGVHRLLYLLMLAAPASGMLMSAAAGYPVVLFGVLPLPSPISPDPELAKIFKALHGPLAMALMICIALHVAAAIKHHFINRNGLIRRMLP